MSIKTKVTNIIKKSNKMEGEINNLLVDLIDHASKHNCWIEATRLVANVSRGANPDAMVEFIKGYTDGVNHSPEKGFTMRKNRSFDVEGARQWIAGGGSYLDFAFIQPKSQKLTFDKYLKSILANAKKADKVREKDGAIEDDPRFDRVRDEVTALLAKYVDA